MSRTEIIDFLCRSVNEILARTDAGNVQELSESTQLLGREGILSSLMLVELMLLLEDFCAEHGYRFMWANDTTMSERRSAYRSMATLADFVQSLPPSTER